MVKMESKIQLRQGEIAPDFSLKGVDGQTHSLDELRGGVGTLIVFMCNHCPYVKARIGEIVALYEEFGRDVSVIGVNSNDPDYPGEGKENMQAFAKERGIAFPYLLDESGEVAKTYGATCTPDPFLFDKDMKLVFHGRISDALEPDDAPQEFTMQDNIRKLFKGQEIEPWFNPSLGCSIKFKS